MSPLGNKRERQYLEADRLTGWRRRAYTVIFESDTPWGRLFDVVLIGLIVASVVVVMLESVSAIRAEHGALLYGLEWGFTILFTVEYILRLICVGRPLRYARSFFGVVDLLAVVPTYFSVLVPGSQFLLVIRLLRILRVFRVLKLVQYVSEADVLLAALRASRRKIAIFIFSVGALVVILGSLMYLIEGAGNGFTSIPRGVYWAIVTLTTVGYGDLSPQTAVGQALASMIMLIGYAIIAVPTGIFAAEMTRQGSGEKPVTGARRCARCGAHHHQDEAVFCWKCGSVLGG